jgi:organic hydroperoxide reductase OsmC/OhrA
MAPTHQYSASVRWTGNRGTGTNEYRAYSRDHVLETSGRPPILCTAGIGPLSEPTRWNPELLLLGALSSCHMLWYLHLCADAGVIVTEYTDTADGAVETDATGSGRFRFATLRPKVTIGKGDSETARKLHEEAHRRCFIANSVNFPVLCEPELLRSPE